MHLKQIHLPKSHNNQMKHQNNSRHAMAVFLTMASIHILVYMVKVRNWEPENYSLIVNRWEESNEDISNNGKEEHVPEKPRQAAHQAIAA